MGRRGPPLTPTPLKILRGETRTNRLNHQRPKPVGGRPTMPADLSPAAKTVWRRQVAGMADLGILTSVDRDSLRTYCEAVARYEQAATTLEQSGPLVRSARHGEPIKNPLHQIVRDNAILIRLFARELGFLPSAREGLHTREPEELDPVERWAAK